MITTLLRWLGIASAADVQALREETRLETESLWAGYRTMSGRLIAATERIGALEAKLSPARVVDAGQASPFHKAGVMPTQYGPQRTKPIPPVGWINSEGTASIPASLLPFLKLEKGGPIHLVEMQEPGVVALMGAEAFAALWSEPESPTPPSDMPPAQNGATLPLEPER